MPQVRNYLEALQPVASHTPAIDLSTFTTTNLTSIAADLNTNTTNTNRKDSIEFTDIQLLAYLTQFEEKTKQEKEMTLVMSRKGKVRTDALNHCFDNEGFMDCLINWPNTKLITYIIKGIIFVYRLFLFKLLIVIVENISRKINIIVVGKVNGWHWGEKGYF